MLKLSIVVPACNVEQWLTATLNSILACDSDEYEVLVIDDGSTDGTAAIASNFQKANPTKVRYIYKENGHYGSVINRAMYEARGLYFRIVDGDDLVDAQALKLLIDSIDKTAPADLILCDYKKLYVRKDAEEIVKINMSPGLYLVSQLDNLPLFEMHAAVYRTDILSSQGIKLTEGIPFTDQQYITYPLPFVQTVEYLPIAVYRYRLGVEGQSVSLAHADKKIGASRKVFNDICDWFDALEVNELSDAIRELLILLVMRTAANHMHLAVFLDLESAVEEMKWVDARIEASPVLKMNDHRDELIGGYALMRGCNYRFTWLYKTILMLYKKVGGEF